MLTHRRLTFGMTLTVAYCGVPDIFVYRRASLIALLAPFVTFTVLYGVLLFCPFDTEIKLQISLLMAVHISGCVGDLYDTALYLFRFRSPNTLMRDTGPCQTFYVSSH